MHVELDGRVSSAGSTTTTTRAAGAAPVGVRRGRRLRGGLAALVQKFLKRFRPDQCWSLTYATTCSKPRVGDSVAEQCSSPADRIRWQNADDFLQHERARFCSLHGTDAQEEHQTVQTLHVLFAALLRRGEHSKKSSSRAVVASRVQHVEAGGELEYGEQDISEGVVDRYQCEDCGRTIAQDAEGLLSVLTDMAAAQGGKPSQA